MAAIDFTPQFQSFQENLNPAHHFELATSPPVTSPEVMRLFERHCGKAGVQPSFYCHSRLAMLNGSMSAGEWLGLMYSVAPGLITLQPEKSRYNYPTTSRPRQVQMIRETRDDEEEGNSQWPTAPSQTRLFEYTAPPAIASEKAWALHAASILKENLASEQVDPTSLYTIFCHMELDHGMPDEIAKKINTGTFSAVFFLQVLRAIEVWELDLR